MADRYTERTIEWGHWGITFMDPQPDRSRNYGVIAGTVSFPAGPRGPVDGDRAFYRAMCDAWISDRVVPSGFHPAT